MKADFKNDRFVQWVMDNAWNQSETLEELGGTDELVAIAAACKRILARRKRCAKAMVAFKSIVGSRKPL